VSSRSARATQRNPVSKNQKKKKKKKMKMKITFLCSFYMGDLQNEQEKKIIFLCRLGTAEVGGVI
jgi:hypothetical protein